MITAEMLTGCSTAHLSTLAGNHRLQPAVVSAFRAMQQAAASAGFNLQPASTFRDFQRQQLIWNEKFEGKRPVLDKNSQPIDLSALSVAERCEAILHWSALPGASRHHWGTDLDVYDPSLLPPGKKLQLEPWEYQQGGYFYALTQWLDVHMAEFDFYRPFSEDRGGVAIEPWHLSYRPLAQQLVKQLTPELLLASWQGKQIAGQSWLAANLATLLPRFLQG
ncbi:M15 family metallopeptidase [Serratia microhaemolytica]|uniref:M15 family metallopeptidase n=1 Tax=Serratia microhaemolytica TaxID=2675110 RepID=UPI000FDD5F70|nr:M15 family metallopeptidase [Serratia microhaemolytica]